MHRFTIATAVGPNCFSISNSNFTLLSQLWINKSGCCQMKVLQQNFKTWLVVSLSCFLHCHQVRNSVAPHNLKKKKANSSKKFSLHQLKLLSSEVEKRFCLCTRFKHQFSLFADDVLCCLEKKFTTPVAPKQDWRLLHQI